MVLYMNLLEYGAESHTNVMSSRNENHWRAAQDLWGTDLGLEPFGSSL